MFNSWNSTPLSGAFEEEMKRKTAELLERTASGSTSGQGSGDTGGGKNGTSEGKPSQTLLYVAVGVSLLVVVLLLGRKGGKP